VYCGVLRFWHDKTSQIFKNKLNVYYILKIFLRVFEGKLVVIAVFAGRNVSHFI